MELTLLFLLDQLVLAGPTLPVEGGLLLMAGRGCVVEGGGAYWHFSYHRELKGCAKVVNRGLVVGSGPMGNDGSELVVKVDGWRWKLAKRIWKKVVVEIRWVIDLEKETTGTHLDKSAYTSYLPPSIPPELVVPHVHDDGYRYFFASYGSQPQRRLRSECGGRIVSVADLIHR